MSADEQVFLEGDRIFSTKGPRNSLGLRFTSEKELDTQLWMNPDEAPKSLNYLLGHHKGELSPLMSRLALKSLALPLFQREFEGKDVTEKTEAAVMDMRYQGSRLLKRYLSLQGDETTDQAMLTQAIYDTTLLQLISRSFRSNEQDSIILLPIGHQMYNQLPNTEFTALRRHALGRANLTIVEDVPDLYSQHPSAQQQRILIKPADITGPDTSMSDLAEILDAEHSAKAFISGEAHDTLSAAAGRLFTRVNTHFDDMQPHA